MEVSSKILGFNSINYQLNGHQVTGSDHITITYFHTTKSSV